MDQKKNTLREEINEIIFGAETPMGKLFDVILLWAIVISVAAVILESVAKFQILYGEIFKWAEWFFTILFTLEYGLRLFSAKKPIRYVFSFFGIVDFLSILPTYLSLYFAGAQTFLVIRSLRMLRVFRVFKLGRYLGEANVLWTALKASRPKITVFLLTILSLVIIMGTAMYLVEGEEHGFTSIPKSIYWAIVTLTTVGYGDIAPQTPIGQALASIIMVIGYAIIAVPTGIVSVELANVSKLDLISKTCPECSAEGHEADAIFCRYCSQKL